MGVMPPLHSHDSKPDVFVPESDRDLLRAFAERRDETAFTTLFKRWSETKPRTNHPPEE
jgi:hypothetical protein